MHVRQHWSVFRECQDPGCAGVLLPPGPPEPATAPRLQHPRHVECTLCSEALERQSHPWSIRQVISLCQLTKCAALASSSLLRRRSAAQIGSMQPPLRPRPAAKRRCVAAAALPPVERERRHIPSAGAVSLAARSRRGAALRACRAIRLRQASRLERGRGRSPAGAHDAHGAAQAVGQRAGKVAQRRQRQPVIQRRVLRITKFP